MVFDQTYNLLTHIHAFLTLKCLICYSFKMDKWSTFLEMLLLRKPPLPIAQPLGIQVILLIMLKNCSKLVNTIEHDVYPLLYRVQIWWCSLMTLSVRESSAPCCSFHYFGGSTNTLHISTDVGMVNHKKYSIYCFKVQ